MLVLLATAVITLSPRAVMSATSDIRRQDGTAASLPRAAASAVRCYVPHYARTWPA